MSFDDVSEMIKQILEQDEVPTDFCKLVFEKTRGNPFFVEEVIKSLKEEEVIYREENKWRIREVSRIEFPETVKDVIKARISRLDDECQRVLTMASFVGKDFTFEALSGVTDVEEDKLLEIMDELLKTVFIKRREIRGEDVCSFADIIVRDVVYEEVGHFKRKKLHGVVGVALEKVYAEKIDKHFAELALHFLAGGDKEKSLDYFLKAGEKAANVYANSEAASYFQSAFKLLEEKEGELRERGRVLERLGDIKKIVGEHDSCMNYWNEAMHFWKQLHEKEKAARLHQKMANVLWDNVGDTKKAKEHHDKALKILEAEPESVELASLYEDIAHMHYRKGDMSKALSWAEKALELAKRLEASDVIASSYASLGTILSFVGEMKKALECFETALKMALDNGYMETALRVYTNLPLSLRAEENERRLECYQKGLKLAKKAGHIYHQSWLSNNLAWMYVNMGNIDEAVLLAEESVALDRKAGNMSHLPTAIGVLGYAYQILGEWDKSKQCYREAFSISQRQKDFQPIAFSCWFLGWLYLDKGDYVKATEFFEKAREVYKRAGVERRQKGSVSYVIWAYIELGEIDKAENLLDELLKFALEVKDKELMGNAYALRGMLLRVQRKWEESIKYFEKSIEEFEFLNARRWDAYWFAKMVLCEYARVYLERDKEGDREKALNLLNQALEIFQKMGAKKDIEKMKSKLAFLETGREMAKPEPIGEVSLPSHITSGYKELDDLLFGGIPRDYAVILTSPSCDERDLLIKRFLKTGAKEGQVTFHVIAKASGTESLAKDFQSNFYLFICNPEADSIIKSLPNVSKLKGVENLNDINIALTSAFRKLEKIPKGIRRVCIEIVSDVLLQHHAVQTRRWLNALIPKLKSKGFTTLAVMDAGMHSTQEVRAILDLFEGEINIYKKGTEKFLKIEKMANQKYSKSELRLQEDKLQE